jgi:hypothetical protein
VKLLAAEDRRQDGDFRSTKLTDADGGKRRGSMKPIDKRTDPLMANQLN